jgi:hypothetical protein
MHRKWGAGPVRHIGNLAVDVFTRQVSAPCTMLSVLLKTHGGRKLYAALLFELAPDPDPKNYAVHEVCAKCCQNAYTLNGQSIHCRPEHNWGPVPQTSRAARPAATTWSLALSGLPQTLPHVRTTCCMSKTNHNSRRGLLDAPHEV